MAASQAAATMVALGGTINDAAKSYADNCGEKTATTRVAAIAANVAKMMTEMATLGETIIAEAESYADNCGDKTVPPRLAATAPAAAAVAATTAVTPAAVAVTTTAATTPAAATIGDTGSIMVDFRTMPLQAAIAMPANLRDGIETLILTMFGVKHCVVIVDGQRWSVIRSEIDEAVAWIKNPRCCTGVLTIQPREVCTVPAIQPRVSADVADLYSRLGLRTCVVAHTRPGRTSDEFTLLTAEGVNLERHLDAVDRNEPPSQITVACTPIQLPGAYVNFLPPVLRTLARLFGVKYITALVPGTITHMAVRLDAAAVVAERLGLAR
jgi:hypothetical protein